MTVLIPAFRPDGRLCSLAASLLQAGCRMLVVDQGSGGEFEEVYGEVRSLGAQVLALDTQCGVGAALRAGFLYIRSSGEDQGVVTADWTGEYKAQDILRLCEWTACTQGSVIALGVRRHIGRVPMGIRIGSFLARKLFAFALGHEIEDVQTALRGYPACLLAWLEHVAGDGRNYLANVILDAPKCGVRIEQIPVKTPWSETSEPWPPGETVSAFLPLIKFCVSGTLEMGIGYLLIFLINTQTGDLFISTFAGRAASSGINFIINKLLVFETSAAHKTSRELLGYYMVYGLLILMNYLGLNLFYETLGLPVIVSVMITEACMFLVSYTLQNRAVFAKKCRTTD